MVRELSRSPWLKKQLMAYSIQGIELLYRRKIDLILASDNWLYSYYKKKGETLLLYNYPNLDLFSNYKSKNKSKTSRKPIFRLCCRTNKFQKYLVYQNYVRC